jgi:RNA polymerase primary sigma factor
MNPTARKAKPLRKTRSVGATKARVARGGVRQGLGVVKAISDIVPANDTEIRPAELVGSADELHETLPEGGLELGGEDKVEVAAPGGEEALSEDATFEARDEDEDEDEDEEEIEAAGTSGRKSEDEPASFLAMYFRDMAELDVLRPEQEFETARNIEQLELGLWKTIFGFAPGSTWMADTVERAVGHEVEELKRYRAASERSRKKASIPARSRFERELTQTAAKLREIDIDRLFLEAALTEIRRVGRASRGLPIEGQVPFATNTKAFREYVQTVMSQAWSLKAAKNEFVKANLRLVVSIARRFNHGRLPLADLIQEGNIGLMKAVERYDYRRGFRFSTYASWWIRHAISRALADKGRAVRLPVHMIDAYHRIAKSQRELQSKLERPPTTEEIAAATGIETDKLEKMKTFLAETPVSLDRPISDDDGRRLIDVLVDPNENQTVPEQMASNETQNEMIKLLAGLKPIEADILRKRFGLVNERERTLKEIGDEYSLSRERVRQLQEQALGKMRRAMAKREIL